MVERNIKDYHFHILTDYYFTTISVLAFSLFPSIHTCTYLYQTEAAARTQFVNWIHCEVHWFTQLTHCGFCADFVATLNSYP